MIKLLRLTLFIYLLNIKKDIGLFKYQLYILFSSFYNSFFPSPQHFRDSPYSFNLIFISDRFLFLFNKFYAFYLFLFLLYKTFRIFRSCDFVYKFVLFLFNFLSF